MSPRAAWRLEALGFREVYDYVDGKLDWLAAGLPSEGTNAQLPRAADIARRDVPRCRLDERLADVEQRVRAAGFDACVVTNAKGVVLGLLRTKELDGEGAKLIEEVMRPGPSTFRPFVLVHEMAQKMTEHDLVNAPITTSDGKLVGLLLRDDAVRTVAELSRAHEDTNDN
jgi:Mg/Co/Ni transporter MgtE